jgi:uncharacterized membrane protein YciS (DUF1049 family)
MNKQERFDKACHHEDELINHRLTWLLTSQTILFAAYSLVISSDNAERLAKLINTIFFVGFTVTAIILVGILAAITAAITAYRKIKHLDSEADNKVTLGVHPITTIIG